MHTSPPSFFCNPRMAILLCRAGELRRHNQRATRHRDIIAFCRTTLCTFQAKNSVTHNLVHCSAHLAGCIKGALKCSVGIGRQR